MAGDFRPKLLRFTYVNWRGDEHEYVIAPDPRAEARLIYHRPSIPGRDAVESEWSWHLAGNVVTRDGDPRPDMGPTRRRSFILIKMRNIEEVEDAAP